MQKKAKKLTPEEYAAARRLLNLPEFDDASDYERYLDGRASNYKWNMGLDGALGGVLGAMIGSAGGPAGTVVGGLAGGGAGMLNGAGWAKLVNYLQDKRLRGYAKDYDKHVADEENKKKKKDEDSSNDEQEKTSEMNSTETKAYQAGFVKRCEERGVDPRYVAAVAASNLQKQAAAVERQKRAEDMFARLDPFTQGFVVRCVQRGVPTAKVAAFYNKAVAGSAR